MPEKGIGIFWKKIKKIQPFYETKESICIKEVKLRQMD